MKDDQHEADVRNRVGTWPERMDYEQLDELCGLIGCELFADRVNEALVYFQEEEDDAEHFHLLYLLSAKLAKGYVKRRGLIFIEGNGKYRNLTTVNPAVVERWEKEKGDRRREEDEKQRSETVSWWANLAPELKEALLAANRNKPRRPEDCE